MKYLHCKTFFLKLDLKLETIVFLELGLPLVNSTKEGLITPNITVVMTCKATGNADPSLAWMDSKRAIIAYGAVLTLLKVQQSDSGSYFCQAEREGSFRYSRPITIKCSLYVLMFIQDVTWQ